jgi:hypothetical protein
MTRSEAPTAPVRCVATTARLVNGKRRTWAYVLDLSGTAPVLETSMEINLSNPDDDNPPFEVRLTPDETMAIVSSDGVVAMIDLTANPAVIRGEFRDLDAERSYDVLSDTLAVANTHFVALSSKRGDPTGQWRADVFSIASGHSGGMLLKRTEEGTGRPHDLARTGDGRTALLRARDSVVALHGIEGPGASILRFDIASPSGPLDVTASLVRDSIVVSRAWVEPGPYGQSGDARHFVVALAKDENQSVPATRVEVFDLAPLGATPPQAPAPVHTEILFDPAYGSGATPASVQLHPAGRSFVVRCNAAPFDVDPESLPAGYDPATGEDVWYFTLKDPIGSVFQYEMTASPRTISDPQDIGRHGAVSISSHYSLDSGDFGYVHTIRIVE